MVKYSLFFAGFFLLLSACKKNVCSGSVKAEFTDATGIGGCGMVIKLNNGKVLEPKNLEAFTLTPQEGQKIWVSYHLAEGGGTVCMIGDVVVLDCVVER
jgi:hypothetical protein